MDSIFSGLLSQVTTGNNLSEIAKSVGGDEKGVKSALGMALPLIMGSAANSAKSGGIEALTKTLTQAGVSSPLDNLGGFLGNAEAAGGSGMLDMLFGNKLNSVTSSISQKSGLGSSIVSKLLAIVAPMVMSAIGKKLLQDKLDATGLTKLLGEESKIATQSSPDVAELAKQFLGTGEKKSLWKRLFG